MKKAKVAISLQLIAVIVVLPSCLAKRTLSQIKQPPRVVVDKQVFNPSEGVNICYPVLKGLDDSAVQTVINNKLQEIFVGDSNSFNDFHEGENEELPSTYECDFTCSQHNYIMAITESGCIYEGGAHGMPIHEVYYIDVRDGRFYQLADLLKNKNSLPELTSIVQCHYQEQKEEIGGFDEVLECLSHDHNFTISDTGLEIIFRPYEIAPYVSGFPSFTLSWQEVANLINTKGDFYQAYFV